MLDCPPKPNRVGRVNLLCAVVLSSALVIAGAAFAGETAEPFGPPLSAAPPRLSAPQIPHSPPRMPRSADADAAAYERCMTLANENPAAARDVAARWQDRGGAHPADHCFAVALIGLKTIQGGCRPARKAGAGDGPRASRIARRCARPGRPGLAPRRRSGARLCRGRRRPSAAPR